MLRTPLKQVVKSQQGKWERFNLGSDGAESYKKMTQMLASMKQGSEMMHLVECMLSDAQTTQI